MQRIEIVVKGQIDQSWSDWFDGFQITHTTGGETSLSGSIRDQTELRGILSRLADLGLELISVNTSSNLHTPERQVKGGDDFRTENSFLRF